MSTIALATAAADDPPRDRFAWAAKLPTHVQRQIWRGDALGGVGRAGAGISTGHAALDRELPGGGWPRGALTELLLPHAGSGALRLIAPALAARTTGASGCASPGAWAGASPGVNAGGIARHVLLIAPPYQPYAPALAAWGIALEQLIWVRTDADADALWAAEQSLKHASVGAVLMWLPKVRAEALRRLQVAAQEGDALAFALRPARMAAQSSPAPLRIICEPVGATLDAASLRLSIVKRRGAALEKPITVAVPLRNRPVLNGLNGTAAQDGALNALNRNAMQWNAEADLAVRIRSDEAMENRDVVGRRHIAVVAA